MPYNPAADSDLGGLAAGGHPDPEIRWGPVSKMFFLPLGPQYGLEIMRVGRGGGGGSPRSATAVHSVD